MIKEASVFKRIYEDDVYKKSPDEIRAFSILKTGQYL